MGDPTLSGTFIEAATDSAHSMIAQEYTQSLQKQDPLINLGAFGK